MSIKIDNNRNLNLTNFGSAVLQDRYLINNETPQDLFVRVAKAYANDDAHAQRLYDYMSKLWFMPATPVLANGGTTRGLPISCFLNEIRDDLNSISEIFLQNIGLASSGGGIGTFVGNIRSINEPITGKGYSSGVIPFIKVIDSMTLAISQGSLRRGSAAVYMNTDHPEIEEFIDIRRPVGGDPNRRSQNLHHGVSISDEFMQAVHEGTKWDLKSPMNGKVISTVEARDLWIKILNARFETGEPYMLFVDNVNKNLSPVYEAMKEKYGMKVKTSNLCSEITLFTGQDHLKKERTAVCCLSSLNIEYYDEWKGNELFIEDIMNFLDNILDDFIARAPKSIENAKYSAMRERSVGLGVMGFHSFLQSKNAPIEGVAAKSWNKQIFQHIKEKADEASKKIAQKKGACPDAQEFDLMERFANKCVTPDTTLLTKTGYKPIIDLVGKNVEIWNGNEWSMVKPFQTGVNEKILKFTFSDGNILKTSYEHRFLIADENYKKTHIAYAQDLKVGNKLDKWEYPIIEGIVDFPHAYTHGFFCGDGSINQSKPQYKNSKQRKEVRLFNDKVKLTPYLEVKENCTVRNINNYNAKRFYIPDTVPDKFLVPNIHNTIKSRLQWLSGLFDADGCNAGIITSINLHFLKEIKEMMSYTGCHGVIRKNIRNSGFATKNNYYYTISFSLFDLYKLQSMGLTTHRVEFKKVNRNAQDYVRIISIEEEENSNTYCLHEPLNNTALFNGVKTMQCAIAPTASISIIAGNASPGIEPFAANCFTQKTLSGSFIVKNKYLEKLLKIKGSNNDKVWSSIALNEGSVQHLDFLTPEEKDVFKTAIEINQMWLIEHAADRQPFVCQAQSLNLFFKSTTSKKTLHDIHYTAWKKGVKSLYYNRTQSVQRAEKAPGQQAVIETENITITNDEECLSCQ